MIGQYLAEHSSGLLTTGAEPPHAGRDTFSNFDLGGVEVEVGELLYSLVRVLKPYRILETGTRYGHAAAYMALALRENGRGTLTTIEIDAGNMAQARALLTTLGLTGQVEQIVGNATGYDPGDRHYEMMLFDTELKQRFPDMLRLWHALLPGGVAIIHDLHPLMGQHEGYPFGELPAKFDGLIRQHELQSFHLPTPRGLYIAQRTAPGFYTTQVLRD